MIMLCVRSVKSMVIIVVMPQPASFILPLNVILAHVVTNVK